MINQVKLDSELRKFMDQDYELFEGFPADAIEAASNWSNAIDEAIKNIIPASTTTSQAKIAFYNTLYPTIELKTARIGFPAAFTAYALALALGMQPAFTSLAPAIPIVFDPVYALGLAGARGSQVVDALVPIIIAWFKLGFATNNQTGVMINWN